MNKYYCSKCGASRSAKGRCNVAGCRAFKTRSTTEIPGTRARTEVSPVLLSDVENAEFSRTLTGSTGFDTVLGGGLVSGSVVLLSGGPGIGKSTLLMQCAGHLASVQQVVLYVAAEESAEQVKMRASRLGQGEAPIHVLACTDLAQVEQSIQQLAPDLVIVDSIHMIRSTPTSSIEAVAEEMTLAAKMHGHILLLAGQVTKAGDAAGKNTLQHIVDTHLTFLGDDGALRLVRVKKSRFGDDQELAVFNMGEHGLTDVEDPTGLFLGERFEDPGCVAAPAIDGSRALLVEVEALVQPGEKPMVTDDRNQLQIVLAVLEKHGIDLDRQCVLTSISRKHSERALDLPLALAIVSSHTEQALSSDLAVFGELSLSGKIRAARRADRRVLAAAKLRFKRVLLPKASADHLPDKVLAEVEAQGLTLVPVSTLDEAITAAFSDEGPQTAPAAAREPNVDKAASDPDGGPGHTVVKSDEPAEADEAPSPTEIEAE